MSRRLLVLSIVVIVALIVPATVIAQTINPNKCLPTCYAYNRASSGGNGTKSRPWRWNKAADPDAKSLRDKMYAAVKGRRNSGTLIVTDCVGTGSSTRCTATSYKFNRAGDSPVVKDLGRVPVPDVGVPIPVHYLLGIGGLVAVTMVGVGLVLRRRAD